MRVSLRRFRRQRHQDALRQHPQGEEYDIEKAELEAQKERDKFKARLFRNAGNLHYPFLKDPFE